MIMLLLLMLELGIITNEAIAFEKNNKWKRVA